ncbi:hypothetical protein [Pseudoalteromonas luteoviolacea]|uniref:Uncharacterized protein n=1 Tax=Pseudoalteromonas luteoviolacea S4060-1 TaxID=1365257 RepID=A0A167JQW2_9GAMM|nr:hypothetical protein [Pseudoalteromonas luteoviolacea]KZN61531.1 hypothetical protein N478_05510 [Pseudoalteromonas luteoviolacea S4060-1]
MILKKRNLKRLSQQELGVVFGCGSGAGTTAEPPVAELIAKRTKPTTKVYKYGMKI